MTSEKERELWEKIKKEFNKLDSWCLPYTKNGFIFQWSKKGTGFGEFAFYYDGQTLRIDNEGMSKKFIKEMLSKMVDDAELDNV